MTDPHCRHCLGPITATWSALCDVCQVAQAALLARAEAEDWLGSARVRAAVLEQLYGGDAWYLARLHYFAQTTGWKPHHNQHRHACPALLRQPRHQVTMRCDAAPGWPVEVDHPVLLNRDGQFALLSQPYSMTDNDRPWLVDLASPYGHGTHALLVTPDNVGPRPSHRAAPAFDCWECHRRIGKNATHYLLPGFIGQMVCVRCLPLHWDRPYWGYSRAAIAARLGRDAA